MHQSVEQTTFARRLRRKATLAEKTLWILLRGRQLEGFKFRRQQPIGVFTVDFLCIEHKLVVECDGVTHLERTDYDQRRDEFLAGEGYRVLRIKDEVVHGDPDQATRQILAALQSSRSG